VTPTESRQQIDRQLGVGGSWQEYAADEPLGSTGVAVRNFPLTTALPIPWLYATEGHRRGSNATRRGPHAYRASRPIGKYSRRHDAGCRNTSFALAFAFEVHGRVSHSQRTRLEADARKRAVFTFHAEDLNKHLRNSKSKCEPLLRAMPPLKSQYRASAVEKHCKSEPSLAAKPPRPLIQMADWQRSKGLSPTLSILYRLLKYAGTLGASYFSWIGTHGPSRRAMSSTVRPAR